jgi:hypothetical protein
MLPGTAELRCVLDTDAVVDLRTRSSLTTRITPRTRAAALLAARKLHITSRVELARIVIEEAAHRS